MKTEEIHFRDPFVLNDGGTYYIYGSTGSECWGRCSGFYCYRSTDLKEWQGPIPVFTPTEDFFSDTNFWAPEVHRYRGGYYMFASFLSKKGRRRVQILKAERPIGPFVPYGKPVTPEDWDCLDGTLYVENGTSYLVFCHEWTQIKDGTICAMRLKEDLSAPDGEPTVLFYGSDPHFALGMGQEGYKNPQGNYVTDGPFFVKTGEGEHAILWSTIVNGNYLQCVSYFSGSILGARFSHAEPLFDKDGGHGMVFTDESGKTYLSLHRPNASPMERPVFLPLVTQGKLKLL